MRFVILFFVMLLNAKAAIWYASATATAGAGTLADPWSARTAFTNQLPDGGDTVYLRGGTYAGNWRSVLRSTSDSRLTVRPYLLERVVFTDGVFGRLGTTMTTNTASVVITNSENWANAQVIIIGTENMQLSGSPTNWTVNRHWGGTVATTHEQGDLVIIKAPLISHSGTNVTWHGFELTSVQSTNRIMTNGDWYVSPGIDLVQPGKGNSVVNCIIYNVGHPAVGFWNQGDAEINGCVFWGVGFYDWNGAEWIRGTAIYSQNDGINGSARIKNIISFRNFTTGCEVFGETGPVKDFSFIGNILFDNISSPLESSSGSTSTSNILVNQNWMMGKPRLSYASQSNLLTAFTSNVMMFGAIQIEEHLTATVTQNVVFVKYAVGDGGSATKTYYQSTTLSSNQVNLTWDYNTYYLSNGSNLRQWDVTMSDRNSLGSDGSGNLKFTNDIGKSWQDWTGWDLHSVYSTTWPTDYLLVQARQLDYDTNIQHVVVICTTGATNATLTPVGISAGETIVLRDAQDYFNPVFTRTYAGGPINLPLNRTSAAEIPGVHHYETNHTNVRYPGLFNAFVLTKTPMPGVLATAGPGRPATSLRQQ